MTSRLLASSPLETFGLQEKGVRDGQGKPSYGTAVSFSARAHRYDGSRGRELLTLPDGTEVRLTMKLFVPATETNVPDEGDRVTDGGEKYIAASRKVVRGIQRGAVHHTQITCRDE